MSTAPTHADTMNDLDKRFTYHPPKEGQYERYVAIREKAKEFATLVCESTRSGRERALALTHIEEAVFWANAAIARGEA